MTTEPAGAQHVQPWWVSITACLLYRGAVLDAFRMSDVIRADTNGTTIMIAERVAD